MKAATSNSVYLVDDRFVEALTILDAVRIWQEYHEHNDENPIEPDKVEKVGDEDVLREGHPSLRDELVAPSSE